MLGREEMKKNSKGRRLGQMIKRKDKRELVRRDRRDSDDF